MPSFDIVSQVDEQEVRNAVDQTNREIATRFDFKGIDADITFNKGEITLRAPADFQLKQMIDILRTKLTKRDVEAGCLDPQNPQIALNEAKQVLKIKQGIEQKLAKEITKMIKESKIKVQASIQGDQVRVTGKKRDDLQEVIALMKDSKIEQPLQYENFRD